MALWKDNTAPRPAPATPAAATTEPTRFDAQAKPDVAPPKPTPTPSPTPSARPESAPVPRKESLIAVDLTIEGKIEGGGSVRIAGKFKGDVNVQGDLTIEPGARLTGSVRADKVTIAGELEGNVEQAAHVNLMDSGVVIGDVKAGSLTVAAGARLRGQAEFGWDEAGAAKPGRLGTSYRAESGNAS